MTVWEYEPHYSRMQLSPANFKDWKEGSNFEAFGAYSSLSANLGARASRSG